MPSDYNEIASNYNQTRRADRYLAERLLLHLGKIKEGYYLDIGCGTGNYSIELHKKGMDFIGMDPSEKMLSIAKQANGAIDWRQGTAENTNLKDEFVNGIIAVLTIHHWADLIKGFAEMYRVLKNGGKMVIFTSTPTQMKGYWLNHYFPNMLQASIAQMPSFETIEENMAKAGFSICGIENYDIQPDLEDLFLYSGKHNPQLYLKPGIRSGISSFTSLANKEEVSSGLSKLKQDIASGKIDEIVRSYENDLGDYLFIVGEKKN